MGVKGEHASVHAKRPSDKVSEVKVRALSSGTPPKQKKLDVLCVEDGFSRPEICPWMDASLQPQSPSLDDFTFPDRRFVPLPMYLEQVTLLFLSACNIRSKSFLEAVLQKYVASTLHVNKAEGFQSLSREAYVRGKVDMWASSPSFRLHPRLTTAFVEESKGRAHVFSTNSITGVVARRPDLTREEVTVNHFERRKNGEWICTKFESVRGPGHWTFEVGHVD